jgi:uncharacterized protein (DUF488 family)
VSRFLDSGHLRHSDFGGELVHPHERWRQSNAEALHLFTVGHSNHAAEHFVQLLQTPQVEVLVDVRSNPDVTYLPHFARSVFIPMLQTAGIRYVFLGRELGGRPAGDEFYDESGYVLYGQWAKSSAFHDGLNRLIRGCDRYRVAVMCSEEDPANCHRRLLVGRALVLRGSTVLSHIRGDGRVEIDDNQALRSLDQMQLGMFEPKGDDAWRSARSVLRKSRPANSSTY